MAKLSCEIISGGVIIADRIIMPMINQRLFFNKNWREIIFLASKNSKMMGVWKMMIPANKKETI